MADAITGPGSESQRNAQSPDAFPLKPDYNIAWSKTLKP